VNSSDRHLLAVSDLSVQLPSAKGDVRAVDQVCFALQPGRTMALVGESGSGKSMLCRAVMGLLPGRALLSGATRILFDGRDLAQLSARELNRVRGKEIGMVLQNPMSSLNPVLTLGRQIMEPMLHHLGLSQAQAKGRALELLQSVGIPQPEEKLKAYPHMFSGGMRQRVAIAMALACDPKLLIADEPTSALDVTVQAEILNLLGRMQRERNMAVILVTHDLAVVAGRAQETAVMYAGRIVEKALTADLFAGARMHYSKALLAAIPRIDDARPGDLDAIEGQPPNLTAPQPGCSFAPRCPRAESRCHAEQPPLSAVENRAHSYACWFPCPSSKAGSAP
jgi:peptide/nickel transport system ATP-binding protein